MENNVPLDLSDEIAVRNYLLRQQQPVVNNAQVSDVNNLYKPLPILEDTALEAYIKEEIVKFSTYLIGTINTAVLDGVVTADKISVSSLASINTNLGAIISGSIPASLVDSGILALAQIPSIPASLVDSGILALVQIPSIMYEFNFLSTSTQSETTSAGSYDLLWSLVSTYAASLIQSKYIRIEYSLIISSLDVDTDLKFGILLKRDGETYTIPTDVEELFQLHSVISGDVITGFSYLEVDTTEDYKIDFYLFNKGVADIAITFDVGSFISITQNYR